MFWADRVAKEIIASGKYKPYWVDDMKTPSGRIHIGSLLGVVIHDLLYKAIIEQGGKATYTYCINDMDPMDGFPVYLNREKFYKYMGWPLCRIPAPEAGFASFSQYYAQEFIDVFNQIGCFPQIIWTSNLYAEGKFDELIKICLDKTEKIRQLFVEQYKSFKEENYFPYQPICPTCGKISTTKIYKWDGKYVYFECREDAVDYTKGCGFKGKITPEKQNGKMPWKIEWAAHWKTLGVTVEWSGKDHMTAGGSHEIASKISEVIFNYPTPQAELYEHILIGGKKMSSSKGFGASSAEMAKILPPEILRFFLVKTHYRQTRDFDPVETMAILDLFDEYDRCWKSYITGKDQDLARIFELSQIEKTKKKEIYLPRFRTIAQVVQFPGVDIVDYFTKEKGSKLTDDEKDLLSERVKYAKIWLEKYAPFEAKIVIKPDVSFEQKTLNTAQKKYLGKIAEVLEQVDKPDRLEQELYQQASNLNISAKEAFAAIYLVLIGKRGGPKAASFILSLDRAVVIKRFKEVSNL